MKSGNTVLQFKEHTIFFIKAENYLYIDTCSTNSVVVLVLVPLFLARIFGKINRVSHAFPGLIPERTTYHSIIC